MNDEIATMSDWNIGYDAAMHEKPCPDPYNEDMCHGHNAGKVILWAHRMILWDMENRKE